MRELKFTNGKIGRMHSLTSLSLLVRLCAMVQNTIPSINETPHKNTKKLN